MPFVGKAIRSGKRAKARHGFLRTVSGTTFRTAAPSGGFSNTSRQTGACFLPGQAKASAWRLRTMTGTGTSPSAAIRT